jgi:hypothetical protein
MPVARETKKEGDPLNGVPLQKTGRGGDWTVRQDEQHKKIMRELGEVLEKLGYSSLEEFRKAVRTAKVEGELTRIEREIGTIEAVKEMARIFPELDKRRHGEIGIAP